MIILSYPQEGQTEKRGINPFSAKDVLIDFTLSNARRFYSSKGNPLALKGLIGKKFPLFGETMPAYFDTENYIPHHLSCM